MKFNGRIIAIGVVGLFNVIRYFYYHQYLGLPFEANFFVLTAFFLAIAWWCGKQFDRVKYFSEKDPLTDTYNRRTIESSFQKIANVCKRENKKLGIILLDLNNFKQINDTYGHQKGDELLKYIATLLIKTVKKDDIVSRWGGDEFIILVPKCTERFNSEFIRQLHQTLNNTLSDSFPSVGASIGFSIYPDEGQGFQELIQKADEAMYQNKSHISAAVAKSDTTNF
ncbi:GGDEF domain-containing protein [Sporosarcina sp. SAFN-015]|uniref:GGDEF domain-containing protein n=1 Tax=Sporosarcina sp. SAFN-015 TaxID=3387274 RepID=UPI003F822CF2